MCVCVHACVRAHMLLELGLNMCVDVHVCISRDEPDECWTYLTLQVHL